MSRLWDRLRSYCEVAVEPADGKAALSFLLQNEIPFFDLRTEENTVRFSLYPRYARLYRALRGDARFAGETRTWHGSLALWHRLRPRVGLLVGAGLALVGMIFSSLVVWDITVTGNTRVPTDEILAALDEEGVRLGAFSPALDAEKIERTLVLRLRDLSWVSLNLRGTVAAVEVRERQENPLTADLAAPSNLVAVCDGQIETLEITGGAAAVRRGQIVKAGTLLVSGVIDSSAVGYRLVRARGEVYARVSCAYDAEIPFSYEEKIYTGDVSTQKSIIFFAKRVNLFKKANISPDNCDKIEKERRLYLFGKIKLPITVVETTLLPYEMCPRTRTVAEAKRKAVETLVSRIGEELADATILARTTTFTEAESAVRLHAEIECIRNIAAEVPIGTD